MGGISEKGHKIWKCYNDSTEILYHTREGVSHIYKQEAGRIRQMRRSNRWRQHRRGTSRNRVIGRIFRVKNDNRGEVTSIAHLAVSTQMPAPRNLQEVLLTELEIGRPKQIGQGSKFQAALT
jgi:hypothetical protein